MGILADQALERLRRVVAQHAGTDDPQALSEMSSTVIRVAVIIAAFGVLASAAFFVSPVLRPSAQKQQQPEAAEKFQVPTGRATYPLADGKTCREIVFDRDRGDIVDSTTAPCDSIARKPYVEPTAREGAWNGFQWGRTNR